MDFALSSDQKLWQASLAGTLARAAPLERVRDFAADPTDLGDDIWRSLTELGVAGLLVPETYGGLGLTLLDAALTAETLGAHVTPSPFLGSAVLAPLALTLAGSEDQRSQWLPRLVSGEIRAGAAIAEGVSGARDGAGVAAKAAGLSGKSLFAFDAQASSIMIVADQEQHLHLVPSDSKSLEIRDLTSIDRTRRLCEITFDDTPSQRLAGVQAAHTFSRLRDAAWVLLAADMLGASQTLLDKAVTYAKDRRQFGRLIGSFQAVKHMCAEMAAALEPCRSLVWYAAYAWDTQADDASITAAHAKAHLSEVSRFIARTSTEVHGGTGMTDLLGLHYWFKRVGLDRQLLGGPELVREVAARLQGLISP